MFMKLCVPWASASAPMLRLPRLLLVFPVLVHHKTVPSPINENQLVGGQFKQLDGQHIHSVICNANLLRRSNLNIEEVRSI